NPYDVPASRCGPLHIQRPQDQLDSGLDRRNRSGILRDARRGNGLPDIDRRWPFGHRSGLGGDRRCSDRGVRLLRGDRPHRKRRHLLASVCPWWTGVTGKKGTKMNKVITGLLAGALALSAAPAAIAADALTLQLKWVTQAQFAGYLVAEAKGFYDEEDLDLTILPGGPNIAPEQVIAGGGADIIVTWMAAGMAARDSGVPLVNIAQPFKRSGLMMICPTEAGVTSEADF